MIRPLLKRVLAKAASARMRRSLHAFAQQSSIYTLPVARYEPGKAKITVLAPHMDDEVLGCGGTIARHTAAGAEVAVVFLTDGRRGGPTPGGYGGSAEDIVSIRKAEAQRAAQVLGIRSTTFLDAEDTRLGSDTVVAGRLRDILERDRPEIIYLPFFLEAHPDHRAANDVLLAAMRGSSLSFECRGYEVWTPLFPNCLVSIDATVHLKQHALSCYQSQLANMDYLHSGLGLNAYRAQGLGSYAARFAEAFHVLDLADYRRLYAALR